MNIEQQLKAAAQKCQTIVWLSRESGVPYSACHGFVKGDRRISLRNAAKMAAVLGLELRPIQKRKGA